MKFPVDSVCNKEMVSPLLVCQFCLDIPVEPQMSQRCGHLFCKECLEKASEDGSVCPLDQELVSEELMREPFPYMMNELNQLQMRCRFKPECMAIVSYKDILSHDAKCGFNPINNAICDNCSSPYKFTDEIPHDCYAVFKSKIEELEAEIRALKDENEKLKGENGENQEDSQYILRPMPSTSKEISTVEMNNANRPSVSPNKSKVKSNNIKPMLSWSQDNAKFKIDTMVSAIKALKNPVEVDQSIWEKTAFFQALLQIVGEPKIREIMKSSDLTNSVVIKNFIHNFNLFKFKNSSIFFQHILLFQLAEPHIKEDHEVFILDTIDNGMSQWIAKIAGHVTCAVDSQHLQEYINANMGRDGKKIRYIPYRPDMDQQIEQIKWDKYSCDVLVTFSTHTDDDVEYLMQQVCPKGMCISYMRKGATPCIKLHYWTNNYASIGRQTLLNHTELKFFTDMYTPRKSGPTRVCYQDEAVMKQL